MLSYIAWAVGVKRVVEKPEERVMRREKGGWGVDVVANL
jgi:hypothetical protein